MRITREWLDRPRGRKLVWLGLALVVLLSVAVLRLSGGAAAQEDAPSATAERGDLVVAVRGVGRVVEATPEAQIFASTSTPLSVTLLVSRGERVTAGQRLAVLDDGGAAAAATAQAESELELARLDLRQTQVNRPSSISAARLDVQRAQADLQTLLGGTREARASAVRLAERNVELAYKRLDQLQAPPNPADVRAAEAEVKKANAALAALLKPPATPSPTALAAAQQAVVVAQQNLARAQATGTPSEVSAAQLELYRAQAELDALQQPPATPLPEDVDAAKAAVESANQNLRKLFAPPNPADLQSARLDVQRAEADLRQLRVGPSATAKAPANEAIKSARERLSQTASPIGIDLARQNMTTARAKLDAARAAERLLAVRAPAAGSVSALLVAPGEAVDATKPILTLVSLDRLSVTLDLSEFDFAQVRRGQKAIISVDALGGKPYAGSVEFVPLTGTDTNGVVTFPVEISLRSAAGVKPGMNVSVRIIVAQKENALQVPLEAILRDEEDRPYVTVVDDSGQETNRKVVLGLANNDNVEILKGLRAGEDVVLAQSQAQEEG
jgi:RND family efflux transporter MFP subunit